MRLEREELAILGAIVGLIVLVVWVSVIDAKRRTQWATEHHCVVIGLKASSVGTGLGSAPNGNIVPVTVYNPSQQIYRCDGGELQIR